MTHALTVPVFSSSLLQVHMAQSIIKKGQRVGIITTHKGFLTQKHLTAIGIEHYNLEIIGMEESEEFSSVFLGKKHTLDQKKCGREIEFIQEKN